MRERERDGGRNRERDRERARERRKRERERERERERRESERETVSIVGRGWDKTLVLITPDRPATRQRVMLNEPKILDSAPRTENLQSHHRDRQQRVRGAYPQPVGASRSVTLHQSSVVRLHDTGRDDPQPILQSHDPKIFNRATVFARNALNLIHCSLALIKPGERTDMAACW